MNIDNMPAGREIDALIAEKVMGWVIHSRNTAWWVKVADENEVTTEVMGFTYGKDRFAPSTNIADAWEVVKKLQQHFFIDIVVGRKAGKANGKFGVDVEIGHYDAEGWALVSMDAPEAPLAICRAALDLTSYLKGEFNNAGVEEI